MKNKEIAAFREALDGVDYIKGKAFAYAVFRNKEILDKEIEALNSIKKEPHSDYIQYENERALLCEQHSEKNEDGSVAKVFNPDGSESYKIIDVEKFNIEFKEVAEKYKEVLEDMQDSKKDFDDFLQKDNDAQLKMVSIDDLPDDISASFLEKIKYMLD